MWDTKRGFLLARFICDGWHLAAEEQVLQLFVFPSNEGLNVLVQHIRYQHAFSARSFSMFACGSLLLVCGWKAGRGAVVYAAVNVYEVKDP